MDFLQLIRNNKILEAAEMLVSEDRQINICSRWNGLQRDIRMGIITHDSATIKSNQITAALIAFGKEEGLTSGTAQMNNTQPSTFPKGNFQEAKLLSIIAENKRRRHEIAEQAQAILSEYRNHQDTVRISPAHDPSGRRLKAIVEKADALIAKLSESKLDSLEATVKRVVELLEAQVPNYADLQKAYDLAAGRGLKDSWIEQQLQSKVEDSEVQITIAERIEEFISKIYVR